ncbi:MAG TPA: GNAT family N-acetyltransferase [Caulobacteraceae bacterium]|nr:GNAT family N-acetyltransferase [Caulobacteraceae bacterium]
MPARIRPYRPADQAALCDICLKTGEAGQDATALYQDPMRLGHVYAAPYGVLAPETSFVAEDDEGVCGYIVGALDTFAFEKRLRTEWWPQLRRTIADPADRPRETWTPDDRLAHLIHHPERTPRAVNEPYPSHLHINLLPRQQGQGMGRRLIETWLDRVWSLGSAGAHLGVAPANTRAMGFYAATGWQRLDVPWGVVFARKRPA